MNNTYENRVWLPTLYKKTQTGAVQYSKLSYAFASMDSKVPRDQRHAVVITEFGQVGTNNPQETVDLIKEGKNIGKSNETTPYAQAKTEAKSKWESKIKKRYLESYDRALVGENPLDGEIVMRADKYENRMKKLKWPVFVQPKLDGIRCIAKMVDGKCHLFTRSQKEIKSLPYLAKHIENIYEEHQIGEHISLDGELYNHEYREDFNKIQSAVVRDEPLEGNEDLIQFHIYDVIGLHFGYGERNSFIESVLPASEFIYKVVTKTAGCDEEVEKIFHEFLSLGYEGAMVRDDRTPYEHKKSKSLLKVKIFEDDEFEIVGVVEGNGKLRGHAGSFICDNKDGQTFKAKLKGELDNLREYWDNFENYKGKQLKVQFQGRTPKNKPRFPVGLHIREELDGEIV